MLEHLDAADEVEAAVLEWEVVGGSRREGEIRGAARFPLRFQVVLIRVEAEHLRWREPVCQAFGHDSLAAADVEHRGRAELCDGFVHSAQEAVQEMPYDRVSCLVLRRRVAD